MGWDWPCTAGRGTTQTLIRVPPYVFSVTATSTFQERDSMFLEWLAVESQSPALQLFPVLASCTQFFLLSVEANFLLRRETAGFHLAFSPLISDINPVQAAALEDNSFPIEYKINRLGSGLSERTLARRDRRDLSPHVDMLLSLYIHGFSGLQRSWYFLAKLFWYQSNSISGKVNFEIYIWCQRCTLEHLNNSMGGRFFYCMAFPQVK